MSTRPRKRARKHAQHDLHKGAMLVNSNDFGQNVRVGLPGGGWLELSVRPQEPRREDGIFDLVQVQLSLYDAWGKPLGASEFLGRRMPQLAWAYLDCRTGRMWQEQEA